jgi:hypothetical protein
MILTITHVLGSSLGFGLAKFIAGRKTGQPGRIRSLKFNIRSRTLHLHHWFLGSICLAALASFDIYHHFTYSFLTGITIQGLTYRDFFKIIYHSGQS